MFYIYKNKGYCSIKKCPKIVKMPKLYKSIKEKYSFGIVLHIVGGFDYHKTLVFLPPIGD